jgi:hypothetical protein
VLNGSKNTFIFLIQSRFGIFVPVTGHADLDLSVGVFQSLLCLSIPVAAGVLFFRGMLLITKFFGQFSSLRYTPFPGPFLTSFVSLHVMQLIYNHSGCFISDILKESFFIKKHEVFFQSVVKLFLLLLGFLHNQHALALLKYHTRILRKLLLPQSDLVSMGQVIFFL